jgi:hypothetical protein
LESLPAAVPTPTFRAFVQTLVLNAGFGAVSAIAVFATVKPAKKAQPTAPERASAAVVLHGVLPPWAACQQQLRAFSDPRVAWTIVAIN